MVPFNLCNYSKSDKYCASSFLLLLVYTRITLNKCAAIQNILTQQKVCRGY